MTWIQTASGRSFDLLHPETNTVAIEDIAAHLSRIFRYTGAVPYSVARHSLMVADILWEKHGDSYLALQGLLHDAHEAYVGDVSSPLKEAMRELYPVSDFDRVERKVSDAVRTQLSIPLDDDPRVHEADMVALATEYRDLHGAISPQDWGIPYEPSPNHRALLTYSEGQDATDFLNKYYELNRSTKL